MWPPNTTFHNHMNNWLKCVTHCLHVGREVTVQEFRGKITLGVGKTHYGMFWDKIKVNNFLRSFNLSLPPALLPSCYSVDFYMKKVFHIIAEYPFTQPALLNLYVLSRKDYMFLPNYIIGYLKNHRTKYRLVCIHFDAFFHADSKYGYIKINNLIFLEKNEKTCLHLTSV